MFQITYTPIDNLNNYKEEITNIFKNRFPRFKNHNIGDIKITIEDKGEPILNSDRKMNMFEFISSDGKTSVSIGQTTYTYTIGIQAYKGFNDLMEQQREMYDLLTLLKVDNAISISLRKINIFDFKRIEGGLPSIPFELPKIFSDELCSNFGYYPSHDVLKNISQTAKYENGGHSLTFLYGLNLPSIEIDKFLQGFTDINIQKHTQTPVADILDCTSLINREMYNIFIWSMNQEILDRMV